MVCPLFAVSVSRAETVEASTVTVSEETPSSSWTFTAFGCSGINCKWSRTFFLNPSLSTVSVNWSAGSASKL